MEAIAHRGVLDRPEALRLFAAQFGVATVRQLVQRRVPKHDRPRRSGGRRPCQRVARSCRTGRLSAVVSRNESMAAQLFGLATEASSPRPTAARLYGIRHGCPDGLIDLTYDHASAGLVAGLAGAVVQHVASTIMTSVVRAGWSAHRPAAADARSVSQHDLRRRPVRARRRGRLAPRPDHPGRRLPSTCGEIAAPGRRGVDRMRRWLERVGDRARPAQSGLEIDVADAAVAAGLPEPVRQHPVTLRNGEVIHLDLAWPEAQARLRAGSLLVAWRRPRSAADQQRRESAPPSAGRSCATTSRRRPTPPPSEPRWRRSIASADSCSAPADCDSATLRFL